jgi:subtilisin family serine protease
VHNPSYNLDEAIVVIKSSFAFSDFMARNSLVALGSVTIPAAGAFPTTEYNLVRSANGTTVDLNHLKQDAAVQSAERHSVLWMPEKVWRRTEEYRGGLSFDDNQGWRTGSDYASQAIFTTLGLTAAVTNSNEGSERIGILDTGIDATHPLFAQAQYPPYVVATIEQGLDFTVNPPATGVADVGNHIDDDGDQKVDGGLGHGTHVAGIIHTGAPRAKLYVSKVLNDEGMGTAFGLTNAIKDAVNHGCQVINLSLGLTENDHMVEHVIAWCLSNKVAVVASAGNKSSSEVQYPAGYDGVISVTAVDGQDVVAVFSNYGTSVDITAPGVNVISAIPTSFGANKYAISDGTSMATPFVTAAVALTHARWGPTANPITAAEHVANSSTPIDAQNPGYEGLLGRGRVNYLAPLQNQPH